MREAITFLTRIRLPTSDAGPGAGAAWFPMVGALIGLVVAGAYALLYIWMPSTLAAVVAVVAGVWLTGAIHEDGLADSFDAFGSGTTGERALTIMRDPRLGTHGTVAVVISLLWRVLAIGSLAPAAAVAGLVMTHSLARTAAVTLMATAPSARPEGLGKAGVAGLAARGAWFALVSGLVISTLMVGWWVVPAVTLIGIGLLLLRRASIRRFGGITGDLLGACEQISELLALAVVAAMAWQGWQPWWVG